VRVDGYGPSTYGDRFADVYDDWYGDVSDVEGTVERVVELAGEAAGAGGQVGGAAGRSGARPVLELGCGSGRLALPLAARGVETWAIDASPAMVDRLRAKPGGERVHAVVGDMAELSLGPEARQFAVVLCAFNTFFNLTSTDAQRRCLSRVAELLAPGGRFVVEAFVPPDEGETPRQSVQVKHVGLDDVVLMVSRIDPSARTILSQHVQLSTDGGVRLRPSVLHYASPDQLDELAAGAGLHLVEQTAGWRGEPFGDESASHVSVYALV
jgi:SAM-dependent methyltransferase